MKALLKSASALLLVLIFSSCGPYKELELKGVKGFQVEQINMQGLKGTIAVEIDNPNKLGFNIYPGDFDVQYSGVDLGKARLDKKVRIKAKSSETYDFQVSSDFKNVNIGDVMKLLKGSSFRNELKVRGELRVGRFLYRKSIPVDLTEELRLR